MAKQVVHIMMLSLMIQILPILVSSALVFPLERRPLMSKHSVIDSQFMHAKPDNDTAEFPVGGSLFNVGSYLANVRLGTPAKEVKVIIDTGSDYFWIRCGTASHTRAELDLFDPASSLTSSRLPCTDKLCHRGCSKKNHQFCWSYSTVYVDDSKTSGDYFKDELHFNVLQEGQRRSNSSAQIVFGCSRNAPPRFLSKGIDGILGLGQGNLSLISQLSSTGKFSRVFAHCFNREGTGGQLVVGNVSEPNMVYTKLVPSMSSSYYVNLHSIAVDGQVLPVDPAVFTDTIIGSVTTFPFLIQEAYDAFLSTINSVVSEFERVIPTTIKGKQCYHTPPSTTLSIIFPPMSFRFKGGSSLDITADDYLFNFSDNGVGSVACIGFQASNRTVLGELVLREKFFVYDLEEQRMGVVSHNCSKPINMTPARSKGSLRNGGLLLTAMLFALPLL